MLGFDTLNVNMRHYTSKIPTFLQFEAVYFLRILD